MQGGLLNTIFGLLFAILLVAIFWSITMYYAEMGSEWSKKEHKSMLIKAITALFLLLCLYAVVEWLRGLIGI